MCDLTTISGFSAYLLAPAIPKKTTHKRTRLPSYLPASFVGLYMAGCVFLCFPPYSLARAGASVQANTSW